MKYFFIGLICLISLISPLVMQNILAGEKIYTIVIDPGHGGKDPGAIASHRREKDVTLQMAKLLAQRLKETLPCKIVLTRTNDKFITLGERNRISKRAEADLFISLHTNASKRRAANGLEIYYLNNTTDKASMRLAARENQGMPQEESDIHAILGGMIQNLNTEESLVLAKLVNGELKKSLKPYKVERIKIKSALFYVLVGPGCPGLLVETGFITNHKERERLTNKAYQTRLVAGIAEGVKRYLADDLANSRNL